MTLQELSEAIAREIHECGTCMDCASTGVLCSEMIATAKIAEREIKAYIGKYLDTVEESLIIVRDLDPCVAKIDSDAWRASAIGKMVFLGEIRRGLLGEK